MPHSHYCRPFFAATLLGLSVVCCSSGCGHADSPASPASAAAAEAHEPAGDRDFVNDLCERMLMRISLMHEVALAKRRGGHPIDDAVREGDRVVAARKKAVEVGLDPGFAEEFYRSQITVSKMLQRADFLRWDVAPPPEKPTPRDLSKVRKEIDKLDAEIVRDLARLRPVLSDPRVQDGIVRTATRVIKGEGVTDSMRAELIRPLVEDFAPPAPTM
ncbi:MAG TPA: chorismate mutase [Pirellulales bacterium]